MDLFSLVARAGAHYFYDFADDAELWDEIVTRGGTVRLLSADCQPGQVVEQAELRIGRSAVRILRVRKATLSELRARREADEERARRDEAALLDEAPVNIDAERDAKDKWRGIA